MKSPADKSSDLRKRRAAEGWIRREFWFPKHLLEEVQQAIAKILQEDT